MDHAHERIEEDHPDNEGDLEITGSNQVEPTRTEEEMDSENHPQRPTTIEEKNTNADEDINEQPEEDQEHSKSEELPENDVEPEEKDVENNGSLDTTDGVDNDGDNSEDNTDDADIQSDSHDDPSKRNSIPVPQTPSRSNKRENDNSPLSNVENIDTAPSTPNSRQDFQTPPSGDDGSPPDVIPGGFPLPKDEEESHTATSQSEEQDSTLIIEEAGSEDHSTFTDDHETIDLTGSPLSEKDRKDVNAADESNSNATYEPEEENNRHNETNGKIDGHEDVQDTNGNVQDNGNEMTVENGEENGEENGDENGDEDDDGYDDDEEEAEIIEVSSTQISDPYKDRRELKADKQDGNVLQSPERTSPQRSIASESSFSFSEENSTPGKKAAGTIDYGSYSKGPQDRLVSRLVSNFESQMDSATETPKVERRTFSKAKLKTIVSPISGSFPADVKEESRSILSGATALGPSALAANSSPPSAEPSDQSATKESETISQSASVNNDKPTQVELEHDEPVGPPVPNLQPIPKPKRITSFQLKPIEAVKEESSSEENLIFGVCVVGFHHARGPEVEYWVGPDGDKSSVWPYLAFQSLPDGSHVRDENFCYFTLLYDDEKKIAVNTTPKRDKDGHIIEQSDFKNVTTLFGISCNRQIKTEELKHVTDDITRSTVQKSVVVVARKPIFGPIKEKLAVVTRAYFIQGDFEDRQLIDNLYENLTQIFTYKLDDASMNIGMPLRELIYRLGPKVLVILKALMLEKRVLFFASNTELLCASQFSIVSLVPNLINNLEDCGSPLLSSYETNLKKPTSLRTSDRSSLLAFMGLPLQLFAGGGIFSPYVPLQQLSELHADETKYFLVGSTNSLVLSQQNTIADIIVNVSIMRSALRMVSK
ncbi:Avl9p [Sugiyamaella lignohabitans]|uniref:Avl9p n=1 Tax=Sugiyamaella lignohabitans TaxID=796027 RepID=A0A167CQZ6_9ASCO|nr:Avl9p [Sugiyamaella lignohabitans]ANB12003.1 Avl9p [Sugiyamaella lignohabitans]